MTHHSRIAGALLYAAALAPAVCAGAVQANEISFVSTAGRNGNACTLAAPCRSLRRAITVTADGGEVRVLDSGFYGNNATIRKSLTINGNGHTVLLGSPVTIDAGGATVALRRLTLNGQGAARDGVFIANAAKVHIEDCLIHSFGMNAITVGRGDIEVFVIGTTARDNETGLEVGKGSTARIVSSAFTANREGVRRTIGGKIESQGNNTVRGNGIDRIGGFTPIPSL